MAYEEVNAKCDWCGKPIYANEDMACKKCYEELEAEVAELKERIGELEDELSHRGP